MKNLYKTLGIILVSLIFQSCQKKPVPPVISTTTATEISTVSAVSGGNITNDGGAPISSKGICWSTTTDPTIAHSKTSESGESLSFTSNITQLIPSTLYYVRAYATNSAGTSYGKSESFKTLGDKPGSNSQNTSNIQPNSATLNGNVNPNSLSSVITFEYGLTTNYGSAITAVQSPLTGNSPVNVSVDLSGLTAGTTYHFRIKAENVLGTTYSDDISFRTLGQIPTVSTVFATDIQAKVATLKGSVNPNNLSTTVVLEWGTSTSYGNTITSSVSPIIGNSPQSITESLSGIIPRTTYHFRIKATNELGSTISDDITFSTLGDIPFVNGQSVTDISLNNATLKCSVNPNYLSTTVVFEWGTTTSYGNTAAASQNSLTGGNPVNVSANLTGLQSEITYNFRIKATNDLGTTYSDNKLFKTYAAVDGNGNGYYSVTIGTQTWLTENLKTIKYKDGTDIPNVTDSIAWAALTTGAYCNYRNKTDSDFIATYGRLYNWYAVNSGKLAITGWHIPTHNEWNTLVTFLGGQDVAGGKMKEAGIIHWQTPNNGATNESGFSALPSGYRGPILTYEYQSLGKNVAFWESTIYPSTQAYGLVLRYNEITSQTYVFNKAYGFPVRLIKD